MDPTGTPLNVRTTPNGHVVGTLNNGIVVTVLDHASDRGGKAWVYVGRYDDNRPIGWVYREFIDCAAAEREYAPARKPLFTADQEACFGRVYDRTPSQAIRSRRSPACTSCAI
jgi:Bacterial SH3 domain